MSRGAGERGQALLLLAGALAAVLAGAVALGWVAAGIAAHGARQRAADLAALAGARALLDARPRVLDRGARRLTPAAYLALARGVAERTAARNGAREVRVAFGAGALPQRVRVIVRGTFALPGIAVMGDRASAEAEVSAIAAAPIGDGEYPGPFALRQGKPMRPDVALAFDRLAAAARRSGLGLVVVSAFRSNSEQARLFAAHPDPTWVARPGTSLHRLGTELDLGPAAAYGWLLAHAAPYGFVRRYPWEPWHFGYRFSPGSASVGFAPAGAGAASAVPSYVPAALAAPLRAASSRWAVGAALLAAQLQQESGFDAHARSPAGALGHRAVHARDGAHLRAGRPVRSGRRDRCPGTPHARPAAALRLRAAGAGGLQRRPRSGRRVLVRAADRRDAGLRPADRGARSRWGARRRRRWPAGAARGLTPNRFQSRRSSDRGLVAPAATPCPMHLGFAIVQHPPSTIPSPDDRRLIPKPVLSGVRMRQTAPRMAPFVHTLRVRYHECDPQSIVFNAQYFAYFDITMTELWRTALERSYATMIADFGIDMVVAEATARFLGSARFDDLVDVEAEITRLGSTGMTTCMRVRRDGELLVEGELRHVFVDAEAWTKTPIPAPVRDALSPFAAA